MRSTGGLRGEGQSGRENVKVKLAAQMANGTQIVSNYFFLSIAKGNKNFVRRHANVSSVSYKLTCKSKGFHGVYPFFFCRRTFSTIDMYILNEDIPLRWNEKGRTIALSVIDIYYGSKIKMLFA